MDKDTAVKALIVSPDSSVQESIRKRLPPQVDAQCHTASPRALMSQPVPGLWDVLILDCRDNDAAALAAVMKASPGVKVMLLVSDPSPDFLLEAIKLGVREVVRLPIEPADFIIVWKRLLRGAEPAHSPGKVMAFMSCKGGSGATFLATNLGHSLAEGREHSVLLLDLNFQFGDAVLYLSDRKPAATVAEVVSDIQRVDMSLLKSSLIEVLPNYGVLAAPEDPTMAIDIRPVEVESLIRFTRTHYDYVLIDVGHTLDPRTLCALDLADHIYPVLQLTLPFMRDAKRLFEVYRSLDYATDKIRPIVNRSERGGSVSEDDVVSLLNCKVFASVPNHHKSVSASINQGVPISKLDSGSPVARAIDALAERISPRRTPHSPGVLGRLLSRFATQGGRLNVNPGQV